MASRSDLQAAAKALGLPATGPSDRIANLVRIAQTHPRLWSENEMLAIIPHLFIHQDLRPDSADRVDSIMANGLQRGMVDSAENLVTGNYWSWAKRLLGGDAYLLTGGLLRFRSATSASLAPGNSPLFHIRTIEGQRFFDALMTATVPDDHREGSPPPAVLYHHSPVENRESILNEGLTLTRDRTGMGAVFVSDTPTPGSGVDVYAIDCRGLQMQPDHTGERNGWFMVHTDVSAERILYVSHGGERMYLDKAGPSLRTQIPRCR